MNCMLKDIGTSIETIDIRYPLSVTIKEAFERCINDDA
jgi:hypothetical protein